MNTRFTGLWRHPDFMKLWVGETISLLGSQVTSLALPLTAALILKASAEQMGVLNATQFLPFLLVGLFAGAWVDRRQRRPVLIIGDIGRALLLATIPLAALAGALHMEQLYVIGFLVGVLTVFFDVAYQSYLPSLVGRAGLVEGNSKLELSRSITAIAGPGVAGLLVQILTAPIAIALDAFSFLASAFFLGRITTTEAPPERHEQKHILREIAEGMGVVLGNPSLRAIAACTATSNLFSNISQTVFILYATRDLNLDAAALGVIYGIASVGGLLGALYVARVTRRFGLGYTIIGSMILGGLGWLFAPLASGSWLVAVPLIILGVSLNAFGGTIYNINQVSLRQTITPHRLLGRMNASMRFIVWGTIPVGALVGGWLGGAIGLRQTLVVGAVGSMLPSLWIIFSPVRGLREQPQPVEEAAGTA
jgi:MFS family permease